MSACPSRESLVLLLAEKLSGPEMAGVESHVQGCERCQKALDGLSGQDALPCGSRTCADGSADGNAPRAAFLKRLQQNVPASFDTGPLQCSQSDTVVCGTTSFAPRVAGYDILAELGRGGMGVVYKARQTRLGRVVALKMLLAGVHAGPHELARFRTEAEAIARLQNPHIVQVFDVGEENGCPYLALEYVEGGNVADQVRGAPLPGHAAARLAAVLASAVDAAHQSGVIHRDLKPANVLLTADGTPKITDFGLAKRLDATAATTQSSGLLGTPHYMAPEQADGHHVGPAADVYGLGAILYYLLTGRPPFVAESPLDTLILVRTAEPLAPSVLQPQVPRDLETVCLKCLEKAPERRYLSAAALAEDLHRFLAGEPIRARPSTRRERLVKWARRKPAVAAFLGLSVVASLSLVALLIARWQDAEARAHAVQQLDDAQQMILARNRQLADLGQAVENQEHLVRQQRAEANGLQSILTQEQAQVREARLGVRRTLYIRDMLLAQVALENKDFGKLQDLLAKHEPPPGEEDVRGFEWHYLWRLIRGARLVVRPARGHIRTVHFSPDGTRLASLSIDDGSNRLQSGGAVLRLCDTATGAEVPTSWNGMEGAEEFAYAPNGQTLATGHLDGTVRLWEITTGRLRTSFNVQAGAVHGLSFSPDGRLLATGGTDKTARIWELQSLKCKATFPTRQRTVYRVEYSPDGLALLAAHENGATLWDIATARERCHMPLQAPATLLTVATFAPDGKTIATAEADHRNRTGSGYVRVWDASTGKQQRGVRVTNGGAFTVAFTPDGQALAIGGENGGIWLWEVAKARVSNTFFGNTHRVHAIAFSRDGTTLAAGGNDEILRVWHVARRASPIVLQEPHGKHCLIEFAHGGDTLAGLSDTGWLRVWDRKTARDRLIHTGQVGDIRLAVAPDSRTIATSSRTTPVKLWDIGTGVLTATIRPEGQSQAFYSLAWSPDGKVLATGTLDGRIVLWNAATGKEVFRFQESRSCGPIFSLAFSPDGKFLVSGSNYGIIRLWDLAAKQLGGSLGGEGWSVMSLAFSPDGKTLATGNWDGRARLWDLGRLARREPLPAAVATIGSLAWEGRLLSTLACLAASATAEKEHYRFEAYQGVGCCVAFSPDGKTLISGHLQGAITFWDLPTMQERFTLKCPPNMPYTVAFSADGRTLAAGGKNGDVYLWEAATP